MAVRARYADKGTFTFICGLVNEERVSYNTEYKMY